jgi:hypothetical protein
MSLRLFTRHYSKQRGKLLDLQLIDPYIPPPFTLRSFRFSSIWQRLKKFAQYSISLGMLKYSLKFKRNEFAKETCEKYLELNKNLYSSKDISHLVTDGYYQKLKTDLKKATSLGRVRYKYLQTEQKPRLGKMWLTLVHICQAKADTGQGKELKLFQCTVRLVLKQSLTIYSKNGKLLGGDPEGKTRVEYVVMERWPEDEKSDWKVKGLIDAKI